uniref:Uncharacterized protein n=1 Tax=Craspedostauros australis TaxID=1486917 RepID=A0A7R9ZP47_9STRA
MQSARELCTFEDLKRGSRLLEYPCSKPVNNEDELVCSRKLTANAQMPMCETSRWWISLGLTCTIASNVCETTQPIGQGRIGLSYTGMITTCSKGRIRWDP